LEGMGPPFGRTGNPYHVEKEDHEMTDNPNSDYEVISPWAEADPVPFRGISPRLDSLAG
jgi:hypothetical protein